MQDRGLRRYELLAVNYLFLPTAPGSPISRVYELDGQVLLLGVGHDADTTLHFAELIAGVPYGVPRHCTVVQNEQTVRIEYRENDHCCVRFALMDEWLRTRGLQSEGLVGDGHARLARAQDIRSSSRESVPRPLCISSCSEHWLHRL